MASIPGARFVIGRVLPRFVIEKSLENVYGDPSKVTPELVDLYFDITRRQGNRDALLARRSQAPSEGIAGRIKDVKAPTLILWGGRDRLIPPASAQRFKADLAVSEVVLFEGLGHVPMEEDPAATVAAAMAFLAKPADRVGR
jgi:pimeloyl-ACP methyl ester carboxylesterase